MTINWYLWASRDRGRRGRAVSSPFHGRSRWKVRLGCVPDWVLLRRSHHYRRSACAWPHMGLFDVELTQPRAIRAKGERS